MTPFGEILNRVGRNVQITGRYKDVQIRDFVQEAFSDCWYRKDWPDTIVRADLTLVASSDELVLPKGSAWLSRVADGGTEIQLVDAIAASDFRDVNSSGLTNSIRVLWPKRSWSVQKQPSTAGVIKIASNSALDVGNEVLIQGLDANGEFNWEVLLLVGTATATSTNSFSEVQMVSKVGFTKGVVTIRSASNVTLGTLGREAGHQAYQSYQANSAVSADVVLDCTVKKSFRPFVHSAEYPPFEMDNFLIYQATSLAMSEARNASLAAHWASRADKAFSDVSQAQMETVRRRLIPASRA